jgi:hypothetical protein
MARIRNSLGPFIGYHGCDRTVAEMILGGKDHLKQSENAHDWLGPGIYFWVDSPERGYAWAVEQSKRPASKVKTPCVIGAFIHPGLCLNLTDYGVMDEILVAYDFLAQFSKTAASVLPKNETQQNGIFLKRHLDCAVIKTVHALREDSGLPAYSTVYGVFEEGESLFDGSGFREKTHVQLAVRDTDCILGYFRVPGNK